MDKNTNTNILREFHAVQRHMKLHMRCVKTQNCWKNPGRETIRTDVLLLLFSSAMSEAFLEKSEELA